MQTVAPTKTNLLRLRHEMNFARLGHELLDQKRNILVVELLNLVDEAEASQEKVGETLAEAYRTLEQAVLRMGRLKVSRLANVVNITTEIELRQRKVMGVPLPVVRTEFTSHGPHYSPRDTSHWVDATIDQFKAALQQMGKLAELKISTIRLATEVRKTIRKVNALEKIAIPDLEETVVYIEGRLEENQREMFSLMKMVKNRLEEREMERKHAESN
ncbi:MAG: V-type ATP synthase subunit D [Planctomycetota bacterium]